MSSPKSKPLQAESPGAVEGVVSQAVAVEALPIARSHRDAARRLFLPLTSLVLVATVLTTAAFWWQYQATHVISRNALVRSHLSQLGVRGEGIVTEIYVSAGDNVEKGDVLAKLDDTHLLAQRTQITARIATLEQRILVGRNALVLAQDEFRVGLQRAQANYRQAQAEADAAQYKAEDSRAFYAARQALESDGAISAEDIRDAAARAQVLASLAEAADASAAGNYAQLQAAELVKQEVAIQQGGLRVLEATRDELRAELRRVEIDIASTRVIAPADGAIVRRLAQPGMSLDTGMPILSMWLTEDTWIEAWIPEERLGDVAAGSSVSVRFPTIPNARFDGRVERLGLATDFEMPSDYLPQTRETRMRPTPQIGVRVKLSDPPKIIRPGMSAIVDIREAALD